MSEATNDGVFSSPFPEVDPAGYRVRFHRGLTDTPLLLGGPIALVLLNFALGLVFAFFCLFRLIARGGFRQPSSVWFAIIGGLLFFLFIHAKILPFLVEDDPRIVTIWWHWRRLRGFYGSRARLDSPAPPRVDRKWRL